MHRRQGEGLSRRVEAANRHKSEVLASMFHELRTSLNPIIRVSLLGRPWEDATILANDDDPIALELVDALPSVILTSKQLPAEEDVRLKGEIACLACRGEFCRGDVR